MRGFVRLYTCGAAVLGCVLLTALPASAQFDRGTISGIVRDASGGVVPGVTITVINQQTQVPQITVSDDSGYYVFPNLRPGMLRRAASSCTGFKKFERSPAKRSTPRPR